MTAETPDDGSRTGADDVVVVRQDEESRFVILVDGELAGFAAFRPAARGTLRAFTHTEISAAFQGRGLAPRLVRAALEATRDAGLAVLPYCPLVRRFIAEHADADRGGYLALVPADRRAEFSLPEAAEGCGAA